LEKNSLPVNQQASDAKPGVVVSGCGNDAGDRFFVHASGCLTAIDQIMDRTARMAFVVL